MASYRTPPTPLALSVRAIRETLNYSQESFALLMGVTRRTVCHWEHGGYMPPRSALYQLRAELRARPTWRERIHNRQDVEQLLYNVGLLYD